MWYIFTHEYFGVVSTNDPKTCGYYIVKFTSNPCTLQGYISIYGRIILMGEKVANACYLSCLRQGYKWYSETIYGKTQPVVVVTTTVFYPQLYVNISNDKSKIPTKICICKVARSLCKHDIFLLTD